MAYLAKSDPSFGSLSYTQQFQQARTLVRSLGLAQLQPMAREGATPLQTVAIRAAEQVARQAPLSLPHRKGNPGTPGFQVDPAHRGEEITSWLTRHHPGFKHLRDGEWGQAVREIEHLMREAQNTPNKPDPERIKEWARKCNMVQELVQRGVITSAQVERFAAACVNLYIKEHEGRIPQSAEEALGGRFAHDPVLDISLSPGRNRTEKVMAALYAQSPTFGQLSLEERHAQTVRVMRTHRIVGG